MSQQIYICAKCGCPDLEISTSTLVVSADQKKVRCPNCKWQGVMSETAGILTTEKIFDTKAVLNLLLFVTTKHAAGPIAQALVFIGLVEKDDQEGLDAIMRAATEGIIEKAFMAAAEHAAKKGNLGEKHTGKIDAPPGSEVVAGESVGIINTEAIRKLEIYGGDGPEAALTDGRGRFRDHVNIETEKNLESKIVIEELGGGPSRMIGTVRIDEIDPKELEALQKALDNAPPFSGPILMAQDTARDMGIDVDALNAGAESVPFPPEMTAENVDLFHVVTGKYEPGWQEREAAALSEKDKVANRFWEEILRDRIIPKVRGIEVAYPNAVIESINVPEWVFYVWQALKGPDPRLLGYPLCVSSGEFAVSFNAGPS